MAGQPVAADGTKEATVQKPSEVFCKRSETRHSDQVPISAGNASITKHPHRGIAKVGLLHTCDCCPRQPGRGAATSFRKARREAVKRWKDSNDNDRDVPCRGAACPAQAVAARDVAGQPVATNAPGSSQSGASVAMGMDAADVPAASANPDRSRTGHLTAAHGNIGAPARPAETGSTGAMALFTDNF